MGVLAGIISVVAAAFYPWPEPVVENDMVGKPLFEEYDASSVRSISITRYDTERNGLDRIELRRSGEKWLIPARKNFLATNVGQISLAINALNNCTVLENRSIDQQDHIEYGVVDPMQYEASTNRSSLGTKIVLEDRNKRELASLIVGSSVRSEAQQSAQKNFVRIPGQPSVYVVEIQPQALSTDFTDWVSPNLLQLRNDTKLSSVEVKNYRIEADKLSSDPRNWSYDANVDIAKQEYGLRIPAPGSSELKVVEASKNNIAKLNEIGKYLGKIRFTDVEKKSKAAATMLRRNRLKNDPAALASLKEFGFAQIGTEPAFEFDAMGGEVIVRTADGVAVSILIGSLLENPTSGDLTLNQYVMLHASVDESLLPLPEAPDPDEQLTPEQRENQKKTYLREVEQRTERVKSASLRASELNQSFADWYYVVSEEVVSGLRPDLDFSTDQIKSAEESKSTQSASKPDEGETAEPEVSSDSKNESDKGPE